MHDIEPYHRWIGDYQSSQDERSPFYGKEHSEFSFHNKVYNYYIHPQWDDFGSSTLYAKVIFADYDERFTVIELIGEWNDCLYNDIMILKRNIIDSQIDAGINKFAIVMENVLNFHNSEDDYYAEWHEEVAEEGGYICLINSLDHVKQEMRQIYIDRYVSMGEDFDGLTWRKYRPMALMHELEAIRERAMKYLN